MSKSVYLLQLENRGQGKRVEEAEKNVGKINLIWQIGHW